MVGIRGYCSVLYEYHNGFYRNACVSSVKLSAVQVYRLGQGRVRRRVLRSDNAVQHRRSANAAVSYVKNGRKRRLWLGLYDAKVYCVSDRHNVVQHFCRDIQIRLFQSGVHKLLVVGVYRARLFIADRGNGILFDSILLKEADRQAAQTDLYDYEVDKVYQEPDRQDPQNRA